MTGAAETHRSVDLSRGEDGRYVVTNRRGGRLTIGRGEDDDFTPVELLLAAIAGCSAVDVGLITGKRATPDRFDIRAEGHKVRDEHGNRLVDLALVFDLVFPEGEDGDAARAVLPRSLAQTRDRLCTVSRTVAVATPVAFTTAGEE